MSRREPLVITVEIVCKDPHATRVNAIKAILTAPRPVPTRERAA